MAYGTLLRIFQSLNEDADMENLSLDSTVIKAYPHSAGAKKGAINIQNHQFIGTSRGGKSTKIHAVVDGIGSPFYFQLTSGNIHDSTVAVDVLSHLDISDSTILADKAYETNEILDYIQRQDADYAISPKSNTRNPGRCDWVLYKERYLVECFFLKLKQLWKERGVNGT